MVKEEKERGGRFVLGRSDGWLDNVNVKLCFVGCRIYFVFLPENKRTKLEQKYKYHSEQVDATIVVAFPFFNATPDYTFSRSLFFTVPVIAHTPIVKYQ